MNTPIVSVIMAGGAGERFWPISRRLRPKQLLKLTNNHEMMIEESVNRLLPMIPKEKIFISTSTQLKYPIQKGLSSIPPENVIGEPVKRNTAGCLVFAIAHILARFGEAAIDYLMTVTTTDHLIGDAERFRHTMTAALQYAEQEDALITIGMHPTRPETGYGYIEITQLNQPLWDYQGIPVYKVGQFLEKPNQEAAERYQASRFYYWNSGMFFWKISSFLNSLKKHLPEHEACVYKLAETIKANAENEQAIETVFSKLQDISIDYACKILIFFIRN